MTRYPKGMVTFLAAAITAPAAGHRAALLRTAITSQGGVIFHDDGMRLDAVFSSALPALKTVLQAQRHSRAGAQEHKHSPDITISIHTGRAQNYAGRYVGPTLNRVISMLDAAHPGQIILSASTHDSLNTLLPDQVTLKDLGEYRLKDLFRTAQIYQVMAPDLPAQFPPLNTLDVRPHNLPIQDSPLIGREQEVASIGGLVRQSTVRLVTLLGSSGIGKTRLALQIAVEVIDEFAEGVYFVALAPVSDPMLLISMISQVLGVKEQAGQPLQETLTSFLAPRHLLLVLDNFEQLLAAAPTISQLLAATQDVKVLVTSQVVLELEDEAVVAVPPLAMPDASQRLSLDTLSQIPAVALFVERARDVQSSFTLTELIAPAVIELCTRLEGLPLAIELVAAQSKRYFPSDMLMMLQNRLNMARVIRRGNTREDTLRPVLDWICEGLGADVAGLFARLGVFAGGCTSESASAICNSANDLTLDVDQALAVLLANHLLLREELKEGHGRYTMLDAIQDYARQRLNKRREVTSLQQAHASYYIALAETAEPLLKGSGQEYWLAHLEDEHHNLRAALTWTLTHAPDLAVRISAALARFWLMHGHYSEGRQWLEIVLEHGHAAPVVSRAAALHGLGSLTFMQGDQDQAQMYYEAALALRRELGDTSGSVALLNNLGLITWRRGNYAQAGIYLEECLRWWRQIGDSWGLAGTVNNLGGLALDQADFDRAEIYYHEAQALREELGDNSGLSTTLNNLGLVAYYHGDYDRATPLLNRALALAQELADEVLQAEILEAQTWVRLAQADLAGALQSLIDCTRFRREQGQKYSLVACLLAFAALRLAEGQPTAAPRLLGAASALREELGTPATPVQQIHIDATTTQALEQISQAEFASAWQAGGAIPLDDLLDQLLAPPAASAA